MSAAALPMRSRAAGWRRRRLRKFERRRHRRALRIIEAANRRRIRARHRAGEKALTELFDGPRRGYMFGVSSLQTGRATPVRLHPNTPPLRDVEHQAKHRKRKAARAARKRNR
jgi:hypothetical protein